MEFKYFSSSFVQPMMSYPSIAELMQQNMSLVQQINALIDENQKLKCRIPKSNSKSKRHRKLAVEVARSYKCPRCSKSYGAQNSMRLHFRRKHS